MEKISPGQLRAARALLNWSRAELAELSGVGAATLHRLETGANEPEARTLLLLRAVFDRHGVEFIENQGVRYKPNNVEIFEGASRFDDFYDFLYQHLKNYGGEVCIGNSDPKLYMKYHKGFHAHRIHMEELVAQGRIHYRILVKEGDFNFTASSYATYRWLPREHFISTSFYAFGECLALVSFHHQPPPYVVLIKSGPLAQAYRQAFNAAWKAAKPPPKRS